MSEEERNKYVRKATIEEIKAIVTGVVIVCKNKRELIICLENFIEMLKRKEGK